MANVESVVASCMDHSSIKYLPPRIEGDQVRWTGEMKRPGGECVSIYFNFTCPDPAAFVPRLRPFLLAFLVPAMRVGLPLQLEQPIDQTTWHNLMEWQAAMAAWFPERLKVIPIRGAVESEPPKLVPSDRRGLTAFSGGVDSCFTALRHSLAADTGRYRRTQLRAGLMVHGFDIPEHQAAVFESAFQSSAQVLNSLGLEAYRLRTNLRSLEEQFDCDWEYEAHGIWLAAVLATLEPFFGAVLIPSSYAYEILRLPWGSNPVTDVLLSSEATPVWHDGAAFLKLGKVQTIAPHPGIQHGLRVCWEGAQLDRNCGRCFKCIATQVCYWLCGVPHPECFPQPCQFADVARVPLETNSNRYLFEVLRAEADRQQAASLAGALASALWRNKRQRLRRKLKQLSLHPRVFLDQF